MAEAIFNQKARRAQLDYIAESAGVSVWGAEPASRYACEAVSRRGGNLTNHLSRPVTEDMLRRCECALCMTAGHARMLISRFPQFEDKIALLARNDIHDPFGGDAEEYERTAQEIEEAADALIERIKKNDA